MTSTRRRFITTLGAVGAGVSAGVLSSRAAAQTPLHVRIGAAPVEPQAQVFYALDNGFFTKNGLTAELIPMRSGSVTIEALLSGQIDVGISNVISFGSALLKGLPLVAIAPGVFNDAGDHNFAIVVPAASAVTKASDLDGKTVGVTSLGSLDGLTFSRISERTAAIRRA
jgi:NitT/TauT family transport system substrate-binding protein